jgi:MSHA biogenesis protein MshO
MTSRMHGFTLIEAVVVIAITAIVGAMVAVFIQKPVEGYFDAARRADMTDMANTALRRIARELHLSLPNSVRLAGAGPNQSMEFLLTRTGGRYRALPDGGTDPLDFSGTDATSAFGIVGPNVTMAAGDQIVIYNLGETVDGANAYAGNTTSAHNRRAYNGAAGSVANIVFTPDVSFPLDSPNRSFHVVETPVTFRCDNVGTLANEGTGTLTRYSGYAIANVQPNPPGVAGNLIAQNLSDCQFSYTAGVTARTGLVTIHLAITRGNETVSLYHQVQVGNVP